MACSHQSARKKKEDYSYHYCHYCHFNSRNEQLVFEDYACWCPEIQQDLVIGFVETLDCLTLGDRLLDRLLERFGTNLAPKTIPKWSQIGAKIDASWGVDFTLVFEWILAPFLLIFHRNMPRLEYRKSIKNVELSPNSLVFRYCRWCAVELTLSFILD